jgi:site-specific DNA recombinase
METHDEGNLFRRVNVTRHFWPHLIIAKLDRACRNLSDFASLLARWRGRGVYVHLLDVGVDTSTPVGEMVCGIMAAVAQWEAQRIGERNREANVSIRVQGRSVNGRATIGFRLRGKNLVPHAAERKIMREIVRLRKRGLVWREIAAELGRRKAKTREGRPWSKQACWRAYHRELRLARGPLDPAKRVQDQD